MLKKISSLKDVKSLSKAQQLEIHGGKRPIMDPCAVYATVWAAADGQAGGYLDDPVTMNTLYQEHYDECISLAAN